MDSTFFNCLQKTKYTFIYIVYTSDSAWRHDSYTRKMSSATIKLVHNDIVKSAEDKRVYRGLDLVNGMKVLLVSDPTTEKSSAAMDVHIGKPCNFVSLQ